MRGATKRFFAGASSGTGWTRIALPAELLTARPKRLRFLIFNTLGPLVHHAGRLLLRLAAVAEGVAAYREALRSLAVGTCGVRQNSRVIKGLGPLY